MTQENTKKKIKQLKLKKNGYKSIFNYWERSQKVLLWRVYPETGYLYLFFDDFVMPVDLSEKLQFNVDGFEDIKQAEDYLKGELKRIFLSKIQADLCSS